MCCTRNFANSWTLRLLASRIGLACVLSGRAANSFIHDTSSGRCFVAWRLVEVAVLNAVAANFVAWRLVEVAVLNAVAAWYCTVRQ